MINRRREFLMIIKVPPPNQRFRSILLVETNSGWASLP
jgi:hypothetical protein